MQHVRCCTAQFCKKKFIFKTKKHISMKAVVENRNKKKRVEEEVVVERVEEIVLKKI